MPRKQLPLQGHQEWATEVPFEDANEQWQSYLLKDGTVLRMKLVVTRVYRFEDVKHPDGEPIYHVESSNMISVSVPDELRGV